MSILITGGAGFIGSHLIRHLLEVSVEPLIGLDHFQGAAGRNNLAGLPDSDRLHWVEADIRDGKSMRDLFQRYPIRRVVHLAAMAGVRESSRHPEAYYDTNVLGTLSVLQACQDQPLERFVYVSSSTVYGLGAALPFREADLGPVPASPYGVTKRAAELMVLNHHQLHGLPAVILRPFSVFGPRMRSDLAISQFSDKIERCEPLMLLGDGSASRDYTHVADVCEGMVSALWSDGVVGEAINLGGGRPVTMAYVIEQLEAAMDVDARVERFPAPAVDLPATHACLNRAWDLLGYQPKVTFEEGLKDYVAWFKRTRYPRLAEATTGKSASPLSSRRAS